MSELSSHALALAAAEAMGVDPNEYVWLGKNPAESADSDYECLEWAREHWYRAWKKGDAHDPKCKWCLFRSGLGDGAFYKPGDYARALVAAAQASKEGV